ncbi:MAG: ATP-binding protein [Alphaproteobacteria bacterium]|nr:ATP-binding protein [Alphaproteobacteria bacterium]MCB9794031.1 ATP-binding protein [Alphaproteobacteria bacterium]
MKQRIVDERARRAFVRLSRGDHQTRDAEWLQRLNAVWTAFHDDGSVLDADIVDPEDDDSGFDLFVFDGDQRRCSIDQLSSGELELLTMAGTLILQDFDGLLLIDEPELHLHPEWQRGLLDALRAMAPEAQLILATHSSEIWDQVYSFERFFLAPPGDPRAAPDEVVSA